MHAGLSKDVDAEGFRSYRRPEGKSGGHGVGWSEIPRYSFRLPDGWEETPVSIADLGGTEVAGRLLCSPCTPFRFSPPQSERSSSTWPLSTSGPNPSHPEPLHPACQPACRQSRCRLTAGSVQIDMWYVDPQQGDVLPVEVPVCGTVGG